MADGSLAARYEYGPFGEPLRASGLMARVNPFQFSTKYLDTEIGLVYYGYRYYSNSKGCWLSRDPIGYPSFQASQQLDTDDEGIELPDSEGLRPAYLFSANNGINSVDPDGRAVVGVFGAGPGRVPGWSNNYIDQFATQTGGRAFGRGQRGSIDKYIRDSYKQDPLLPIILFGYSRGGITIVEIARWILSDKKEMPCARVFLVGIDPVVGTGSGPIAVPKGVVAWTNFYQRNHPGWGILKVLTGDFNDLNGTPYSGVNGENVDETGETFTTLTGEQKLVNHAVMPGWNRKAVPDTINQYKRPQ
jgi:RHS repeat-associated protein